MFKYLPTIGMAGGPGRRLNFEKLIRRTFLRPDERTVSADGQTALCYKFCGDGFGVYVSGKNRKGAPRRADVDAWGVFARSGEPLAISGGITKVQPNNSGTHAFCESAETGVCFEFRLTDPDGAGRLDGAKHVDVAMLGLFGKILLPVYKDEDTRKNQDEAERHKRDLTRRARSGDGRAAGALNETLSQQAQDARERLRTEDVFTVLEGFMMSLSPHSAVYSVLADIERVERLANRFSDDDVVKLLVNSGGLRFHVLVNSKDLIGRPERGMRFSGAGMLQGG